MSPDSPDAPPGNPPPLPPAVPRHGRPVLGPIFLERPPRMLLPLVALGLVLYASGIVSLSLMQSRQIRVEWALHCCGMALLAPIAAAVLVELLGALSPDPRLARAPKSAALAWRCERLRQDELVWQDAVLCVAGDRLWLLFADGPAESHLLASVSDIARNAADGLYAGGFLGLEVISFYLPDGVLDVRLRGGKRLLRTLAGWGVPRGPCVPGG